MIVEIISFLFLVDEQLLIFVVIQIKFQPSYQSKLCLTHYCLKHFSRQILRSILRYALIVYRLIDVALIGNFFMITSFFQNEILIIR